MSDRPSTWAEDRKLVFAKLDDIGSDIKGLCHDLNGNGKPGLKERVGDLEKVERARKWIIRLIVGAIVAGGISTFFSTERGEASNHPTTQGR